MRKNKEKNNWNNTLVEATYKANIVQFVTFNQATWIRTVHLININFTLSAFYEL